MSIERRFHPPLDPSGPPRRVLIISAEMGEGHNAAARAIREVIDEMWPGCQVEQLDTIELRGSRFARLTRRAYSFQLSRLPQTYQAFYDALSRSDLFAGLAKRVIGQFFGRRLAPLVAGRDDDLVISTYPFGSAALAWLRRYRGSRTPVVTYIPAFHVHPLWAYPEVDLHVVMYDSAAVHARTERFDATMRVGAPPVQRRFGTISRAKGRAEFGVADQDFVVLVTGGAWGLGQLGDAVAALLACPVPVRVVAVCGRNARLAAKLRALPANDRLSVLDYVDTMPELMAAADVVVTNGAGVTVLESLRTPRPVIAFSPLVGHGRAASAEMARRHLALVAEDVPELVNQVTRLATDGELSDRLRQAGQSWAADRDLRHNLAEMAALTAAYRHSS